ncbi:MAG: thioredoxin domain-containing protein, partial [Flammeovirgaceae bacterium]|nr:thioredoxin domain-containing protein [Flammeovirgaceae bacterium]
NKGYITKANHWLQHTIENFYDNEDGYFHYTSKQAEELIARKKEIFDNVIPSSNGVMAKNLFYMGVIMDNDEWKKISSEMVLKLSATIRTEPAYLSNWGIVYSENVSDFAEVVIVGKDAASIRQEMVKEYLPFTVFMGTTTTSDLPLIKEKTSPNDKTTIYVCYNKTCKLPVHTVAEALQQIKHYNR